MQYRLLCLWRGGREERPNRIMAVQESRRFGLDAECKLRHATQQKLNQGTPARNKPLFSFSFSPENGRKNSKLTR
jgi:hypothetical protein